MPPPAKLNHYVNLGLKFMVNELGGSPDLCPLS